ncbi:MAG TPA: type I glyceraldehyde-3-phosphate dehydrogenase [Thermodesulfobacteriota bacterium]|nr:type I glyceraldehyde-3-phosphate dehydrogenase [Thermodesulfobacteriota bacterium]
MAARVAINGFGRIGRMILRASLDEPQLDIVAVNDLTDAKTLAHLLRYDSVHGTLARPVTVEGDGFRVGDRHVKVLSTKNPAELPWKSLGVDIVLECTGLFTDRDKAAAHLAAGARTVIISAPATGADLTVCMGVNEAMYDPARHRIVSNASCTTNCLAPVAKVLHERFRIVHGLMTTVHSYTNDQQILDLPHKDLRRARAAALSMIPTTTGAARAVGLVLPELKGKLDGIAIRVPTPNVSIIDLNAVVETPTTAQAVNDAFRAAAAGPLRGILEVCDEPLVSRDFNGTPYSAIVDAPSTYVMEGTFVKVMAWYDNEWAFSCRMRDLALYVASRSGGR